MRAQHMKSHLLSVGGVTFTRALRKGPGKVAYCQWGNFYKGPGKSPIVRGVTFTRALRKDPGNSPIVRVVTFTRALESRLLSGGGVTFTTALESRLCAWHCTSGF